MEELKEDIELETKITPGIFLIYKLKYMGISEARQNIKDLAKKHLDDLTSRRATRNDAEARMHRETILEDFKGNELFENEAQAFVISSMSEYAMEKWKTLNQVDDSEEEKSEQDDQKDSRGPQKRIKTGETTEKLVASSASSQVKKPFQPSANQKTTSVMMNQVLSEATRDQLTAFIKRSGYTEEQEKGMISKWQKIQETKIKEMVNKEVIQEMIKKKLEQSGLKKAAFNCISALSTNLHNYYQKILEELIRYSRIEAASKMIYPTQNYVDIKPNTIFELDCRAPVHPRAQVPGLSADPSIHPEEVNHMGKQLFEVQIGEEKMMYRQDGNFKVVFRDNPQQRIQELTQEEREDIDVRRKKKMMYNKENENTGRKRKKGASQSERLFNIGEDGKPVDADKGAYGDDVMNAFNKFSNNEKSSLKPSSSPTRQKRSSMVKQESRILDIFSSSDVVGTKQEKKQSQTPITLKHLLNFMESDQHLKNSQHYYKALLGINLERK